MLQPLKKKQIICVNKCNKENVNITKDIDPKNHPISKNVRSLSWAKISLQSTSLKALKFTPSHLSSFSVRISFGIFLRALSLSKIIGNLLDLQGPTFGVSYHGHIITITITGSL
jgi:hypothetical protein